MFSEQDVDRELKAALSVSPSPDFEARVLQRVEQEARATRRWWPVARGLKTVGLPVAASIVIVAGLFSALNRTPVVVAPPAMPPVAKYTPPAPPEGAPATPKVKPIEAPRIEAARAARSTPRAAEPEVLVPLNQMEAVRRLVRAVNEGRIVAPTEPVEAAKTVASEIIVAPLVVDPIPVPAVEPAADSPSPIIRGHQ